MVTCDICGKEFKNTQGLRGHKNFVHKDNARSVEPSVTQQATQQIVSSNSSTQATTEQRLSQLEDRFTRLEHITGVKETDELDKLLGITDTSLAEQVSQLTEQLGKVTEQLESKYVSRETVENTVAELTGECELLHKEISNVCNLSAVAKRKSRESYENSLLTIERRVTATANELYELSRTTKHVQESIQDNRSSINQLTTKLTLFEQALSELRSGVARVEKLTRRVPTGEIISIRLSDKREHHFREYKSKEGLARPHRTSRDLILGDRWIDLAEPED